MKESIAHILEVVVVTIALFAVIAIITYMTSTEKDSNGKYTGSITNSIDNTISGVFEKGDQAIDYDSGENQ